jgi:hypothetical protein
MKKADKKNEGSPKPKETNRHEEIKTDFPLSEKDQVKQAEEKMRNRTQR